MNKIHKIDKYHNHDNGYTVRELIFALLFILLLISIAYSIPQESTFTYLSETTTIATSSPMVENNEIGTMTWISRFIGVFLMCISYGIAPLLMLFIFMSLLVYTPSNRDEK